MRGFIILILASFFHNGLDAQVVIGGEETKKEETTDDKKDSKPKKEKVVDGKTTVYAMTNWSSTDRVLTENGDLYGEPLGTRADEKPLNTWSFGIGLRNKIHNNFYWDGGISFYRNGESYLFTGLDTMFAYQTTYSYISMPLRINVCHGENFVWNAGVGIVPQMFNRYIQEQQWETSTGAEDKETIKTKSGYNTFAISAIFNVGLTMNFSNGWGVFVSPEARIQLNSTYTELSPYIHKGRAYGISFGLIRNL